METTPVLHDKQYIDLHMEFALATAKYNRARNSVLSSAISQFGALRSECQDELFAMEEFYDTNPWARYWLCTSSADGHVHTGWSCPSLRMTSELSLLWQLSGADVEQMIAKTGTGACTKCFPEAPVAVSVKGVKAKRAILAEHGTPESGIVPRDEMAVR